MVHKANEHTSIAVKTPAGLSEWRHISNTIMQRTVWSGIFCASTIDKLGKQIYENPDIAYEYRWQVVLPPLEMVDDVLTISLSMEPHPQTF